MADAQHVDARPNDAAREKPHDSGGRNSQAARVRGVLNLGDLKRLPDADWVIDDFPMRRSLSVLHGNPGVMKSFTALHIGHVIAYGLPWLPDSEPTERGLVLYLAFEGLRGFKNRRLAALRHRHLPDADFDALKVINPFKDQVDGIAGIDFDLLDAQSVMRFIMMALEIKRFENLPINLVVIDVLKEAIGGIESV
jgi:RecA-family ATPase